MEKQISEFTAGTSRLMGYMHGVFQYIFLMSTIIPAALFGRDADASARKSANEFIEGQTTQVIVGSVLEIVLAVCLCISLQVKLDRLKDAKRHTDFFVLFGILQSIRALFIALCWRAKLMYDQQIKSSPMSFSSPLSLGLGLTFAHLAVIAYLFVTQACMLSKQHGFLTSCAATGLVLAAGVLALTQGGHVFFYDDHSLKIYSTAEKPRIISHRLGAAVGPEGSAFNIEYICSRRHMFAMELDIRLAFSNQTKLPHLNHILVLHDDILGQSTDDPRYLTKTATQVPIEELVEINIGEHRLRVDPFGVYHGKTKFSIEEINQLQAQRLMTLETGIETIQKFCTKDDGTPSAVMIDIKDVIEGLNDLEVLRERLAPYASTEFLVRAPKVWQVQAGIQAFADMKNVVIQTEFDVSSSQDFDEYVALYSEPVNKYTIQDKTEKPVVIWNFASEFVGYLLYKTGIKYLTSDDPLHCLANKETYLMMGGGIWILWLIISCIIVWIPYVLKSCRVKRAVAKQQAESELV